MHNLIHVADNVKYLQCPLSDFSAFWGENYLGFVQKLVKSPKKPLTQIANRLHELQSNDRMQIRRRSNEVIITMNINRRLDEYDGERYNVLSQAVYN